MAGLLVAIGVMGLLLSMAMPTWQTFIKREKEAELVFRGGQYARAITLYGQQFAGAFPPSIEALVEGRFLREAYADPMTKDGEFEVVTAGTLQNLPGVSTDTDPDGRSAALEPNRETFSQAGRENNEDSGPIIGVRSRSTEDSLMVLNGLTNYADWIFTPSAPGLLGGHTEAQPIIVDGASVPTPGQLDDANGFGAGGLGAFGEAADAVGRPVGAGPDSRSLPNGDGPTSRAPASATSTSGPWTRYCGAADHHPRNAVQRREHVAVRGRQRLPVRVSRTVQGLSGRAAPNIEHPRQCDWIRRVVFRRDGLPRRVRTGHGIYGYGAQISAPNQIRKISGILSPIRVELVDGLPQTEEVFLEHRFLGPRHPGAIARHRDRGQHHDQRHHDQHFDQRPAGAGPQATAVRGGSTGGSGHTGSASCRRYHSLYFVPSSAVDLDVE